MRPTGAFDEPLNRRVGAPDFESATVLDVMRLGVITCRRDTSLREVARLMTTYRTHSVVVSDLEGARPWGVLSDIDLARAAGDDLDASTAGSMRVPSSLRSTPTQASPAQRG